MLQKLKQGKNINKKKASKQKQIKKTNMIII